MIQRLAGLVHSGRLVNIRHDGSVTADTVVGVIQQVGSEWSLVHVVDAGFYWGGFRFLRTDRVVDVQELPAETAEYMTRGLRTRDFLNVPYFTGLGRTDEVLRAAAQAPDRPEFRLSDASRLLRLHIGTDDGDVVVRMGRLTSVDRESCAIREITPFGAWRETVHLSCAEITRVEVDSRLLKGLLEFGDPFPAANKPTG